MPLCSRQALLYQTRLAQLNEDKHKCRIVPQNGLLMPLVDDRHPLLVAGPCASAVNRLKPMEKFFGRETGKMEGIRRPRLQQGGASEEKLPAAKQGARRHYIITGSKGQEARSKAKALFSTFGSRTFRNLAAGKRKKRILVGAASDVRHYRKLPEFRPSLPCCLGVARALFSSLGSRGFRGLPAGKRKRSLPFCLSVARALFSSLGSRGFRGLPAGKKKKTASFLSVQIATLGTTGHCPEARSVLHCHAA